MDFCLMLLKEPQLVHHGYRHIAYILKSFGGRLLGLFLTLLARDC